MKPELDWIEVSPGMAGPPGMVHGPWISPEGCEMLKTRYRAP